MSRRSINKNNYDAIYADYTNINLTIKQIAENYNVSVGTVHNIVRKFKNGNHNIEPRQTRKAKNIINVEFVPSSTRLSDVDKQNYEDRLTGKSRSSIYQSVQKIHKSSKVEKQPKHRSKLTGEQEAEQMINLLDGYNE